MVQDVTPCFNQHLARGSVLFLAAFLLVVASGLAQGQLPCISAFLESVPIAKAKPTMLESAQMIEASEHRVAKIVSRQSSPQTGLD